MVLTRSQRIQINIEHNQQPTGTHHERHNDAIGRSELRHRSALHPPRRTSLRRDLLGPLRMDLVRIKRPELWRSRRATTGDEGDRSRR